VDYKVDCWQTTRQQSQFGYLNPVFSNSFTAVSTWCSQIIELSSTQQRCRLTHPLLLTNSASLRVRDAGLPCWL